MKAHDWIMFGTVLAVYALHGLLPSKTAHVFFRFCEVITNLLNRRVDVQQLADLHVNVIECLCLMELHYPKSELTICFHLLAHAVFYLQAWGPFVSYWMFPYERFLGFLCNAIHNRAKP